MAVYRRYLTVAVCLVPTVIAAGSADTFNDCGGRGIVMNVHKSCHCIRGVVHSVHKVHTSQHTRRPARTVFFHEVKVAGT